MVWTNPTLRTTGDIVSVSVWNVDVIENLSFLGSQHDHNGDHGDGGTTALSVPSGLIAIFDTSCPAGWTRVSAFDNRFLQGSPSYGITGGATGHTHEYNLLDSTSMSIESMYSRDGNLYWATMSLGEIGVTSPGELRMFPYSHGTFPTTGYKSDSDTPTVQPSGSYGEPEPYPSYIDVIFCKKD